MNSIDQQILDLLAKGNDRGMQLVFRHYYDDVCATIYSVVKRTDLVEDLAQELFIRFWNKRESIHVNRSLKSYLKTMAVREGIAHLRKKKDLPEDLPTQDNSQPEEGMIVNELQGQIQDAINGLPTKCKEVFLLSREEMLSYKEIAQKLEISPKTVENQMSKALRVLRTKLKAAMYTFF